MCVFAVETIQVGLKLDEGCWLGGLKIPGRPAGEESWGAR